MKEVVEISKSIMMNINSKLPQHILEVIFSKLPVVQLPFCRQVCKAWNHLVLDHSSSTCKIVPNTFLVCTLYLEFPPYLGAQTNDMWPGYLRMHCIDFDENYSQGMNLVGSFRFASRYPNIRISNQCNGLLLCIIGAENFFSTCANILNPMTNEYTKLPKDSDNFFLYGFGFSPKVNQYKVARVFFVKGKYGCVVEIFTLGKSSKWSHVDSLPFVFESDGVYFNGGLYWVGIDEEKKKVLCRLDVEDENFETIDLPKVAYLVGIGVFNGCVYATFMEEESCKIEVWMLRKLDVWMLEFVIDGIPRDWELGTFGRPWKGPLQLIKTCENGEILCLFDRFYLFVYNIKTKRIKTLIKEERDERSFWVYQIESLSFDSLHKILVG